MKKSLFTLSTTFATLLLSAFISAQTVMAQITNPAIGVWGNNNAGASDGSLFATIFVYFWRAIILLGALLVIFFFVSGAIDYISAGGEKGKTESARNKITTAVIGFIILMFSFTAIAVIGNIIGFNLLDINFAAPNPAMQVPPGLIIN